MPNDYELIRTIAALSERVTILSDQMAEVRKDVGEMKQMADRYKGAFLLIVGIGGAAGWLFSLWERFGWHS